MKKSTFFKYKISKKQQLDWDFVSKTENEIQLMLFISFSAANGMKADGSNPGYGVTRLLASKRRKVETMDGRNNLGRALLYI